MYLFAKQLPHVREEFHATLGLVSYNLRQESQLTPRRIPRHPLPLTMSPKEKENIRDRLKIFGLVSKLICSRQLGKFLCIGLSPAESGLEGLSA